MPRFVLEIGTEELPPRFFPPALAQLREDGAQMLNRARLAFRELKVYGTPRRLVLIAEDLAERQAPETREERGPAAKVAFDESGKPTKAALGFAKRHNLSPDALTVKDTDQGRYVFAIIQEPELPAKEALAQLLPQLITGISFPKTMRWGVGKLRFGRPIRWLLALVDTDIVEFELDGIKSGRLTRGHPVLAEGMFAVAHASRYEVELEERSVMVDPDKRKRRIEEQLARIAADHDATWLHGGRWYGWLISKFITRPDAFATDMVSDLVLQTTFLVEWPTCATGRYDESFLGLPMPILMEEMQRVQSYFPVARDWQDGDTEWHLLPLFIAVRDGGDQNLHAVIAGWENVLRAKLIDASFFYEQDLKTPLEQRVEALKGVVFHEKLGTMYDKKERIRAIAADAAQQLSLSVDDAKALDRAAELCKGDLVTEVVRELSDLQGAMGREYAKHFEEPEAVSDAIGEHYRPRFAKDDPPRGLIGALLGLADKLDTVSACFAIGLVPTGSADPLGLRREGLGAVRILAETPDDPSRLPIPLSELSTRRLIRVALDMLTKDLTLQRSADEVAETVMSFLQERLATRLREQEVRYDLVNAALAIDTDIRDSASRARILNWLAQKSPNFMKTVIACTRAINISKGFGDGKVDQSIIEPGAERALWEAFENAQQEVDNLEKRLRQNRAQYDEATFYESMFRVFDLLRAPIGTFFDDVLVMHEDEALRRNRLAMCWQLSQLFRCIADFTLIVQT